MTVVRRSPALTRRCYGALVQDCVQKRHVQHDSRVFKASEEVRSAVHEKRPVVSLETTIYTHGFPYPDNLQLATRLDAVVRQTGAIPAHCGILGGQVRVGMDHKDMQQLLEYRNARKVSRRDLGPLLGSSFDGSSNSKLNGGTTIAGTMILSHLAGIKVFATGGLGGVHRGVEHSMDVSADLTEFGRTPVAVVSSGCKGFLDIPKTLEYLETEGACVGTFADGREGPVKFPAFWSRESPVLSPLTVRDERQAAAMIHAQSVLGLSSGLFFANPVPEADGIPPDEMNRIIDEALSMADRKGVTGAANTPFVLNAIKELSQGRSVLANRALIESNVTRGSLLAVELSKLEHDSGVKGDSRAQATCTETIAERRDDEDVPREKVSNIVEPVEQPRAEPPQTSSGTSEDLEIAQQPPADVAIIGSVAIDLSCDYEPFTRSSSEAVKPAPHTSNPASIKQSLGGVGYNIAKATRLVGGSSILCSVLGNDVAGKAIDVALEKEEGFQGQMITLEHQTAQYVAVNDRNKDLLLGMADMGIFERLPLNSEEEMSRWLNIRKPKWLVADANWSPNFLSELLREARGKGTKTAFEPVSAAKSTRLFSLLKQDGDPIVDLATPNMLELFAMYTAAQSAGVFDRQDWWQVIDSLGISSSGARVELAMATSSDLVDKGVPQQTIQLLPFIPCILTKLGPEGVLMTELLSINDPRLSSPDAAPHILSRSKTNGNGVGGVYMRLFPPTERLMGEDVVSTNGVGDTFLGVLMAALSKRDGVRVEDAIDLAQKGSFLTLKSKESVSPELDSLRLALEML